jgi:hypothetical protein
MRYDSVMEMVPNRPEDPIKLYIRTPAGGYWVRGAYRGNEGDAGYWLQGGGYVLKKDVAEALGAGA